MDPNENKQDLKMEAQVDVGTAADVEEVMKKYDRESNVRVWEGMPKTIVRLLSIIFSVYCIWVTLFSVAIPEVKLNVFLGSILILGYLNFPIRKGITKVNHMPWYDILIMVAGAFPFFYFAYHAKGAELSLEFAASYGAVPYHPGAVAYFADKGITVTGK